MTTAEYLKQKFPNGITLKDCITEDSIKNLLPKGYLPHIEGSLDESSDTFIEVFHRVSSERGIYNVYYLYIRPDGKIGNYQGATYIQLLRGMKGFLASFSIPVTSKTPENLELSFLVDISQIDYHVDSEMKTDPETKNIVLGESLLFNILDLSKYEHIQFDPLIANYMDKKEELCQLFEI